MARRQLSEPPRARHRPEPGRCGLARALSKLGYCSRSQARGFIQAGRVQVNGVVRRDPQWWVTVGADLIAVDGCGVQRVEPVYLMLNKPRGLVTTTADEQGRATVYDCLAGEPLPGVFPVGRLDRASEGLLLFTNDTPWAAGITDPATHLDKVYHLRINRRAEADLIRQMIAGQVADGERLRVKSARALREGSRNSWLEVVLDEGRNRHLRRLCAALGLEVRRLVRVAIGGVQLGDLPKGRYRHLTKAEIELLAPRPR